MDIQRRNPVNFGIKLETAKVLEVTSQRIFESDGIEGVRDVIKALSNEPIKATGSKGYRYFAIKTGREIITKYSQIAEATEEINRIAARNPYITKSELNQKIRPLIDKIGNEIDITI